MCIRDSPRGPPQGQRAPYLAQGHPALPLGRGTWAGYRAGAGRKRIARDARGYVPHTRRPKVTKSTPVHATLRCVDGLPSLRRKTHQRIIEAVFAEENRKGFRLIHFSIQGNHLHLIAEGDTTEALSRGIQRLASRIARTFNKRWGRRGKFFKEPGSDPPAGSSPNTAASRRYGCEATRLIRASGLPPRRRHFPGHAHLILDPRGA